MIPKNSRNAFARHPLVTFYLLAYLVSWLGFVPMLMPSVFSHPLWKLSLLLPGCGPAIAAVVTARSGGDTGEFLPRLFALLHWRVDRVWYSVALLFPLVLALLANGLGALFSPHAYALPPASSADLFIFVLTSIAANPWEEVGWRGFALPRLQVRYSPLLASLIVGVLWGLWHIPLFLGPGNAMSTIPFWYWFAGLLGRSVLYTWLFNRTGQSLAVVILFHIAFNSWGIFLGTVSLLATAFVHLAAAGIILLLHGPNLSFRSPGPGILNLCNTPGSAPPA